MLMTVLAVVLAVQLTSVDAADDLAMLSKVCLLSISFDSDDFRSLCWTSKQMISKCKSRTIFTLGCSSIILRKLPRLTELLTPSKH